MYVCFLYIVINVLKKKKIEELLLNQCFINSLPDFDQT